MGPGCRVRSSTHGHCWLHGQPATEDRRPRKWRPGVACGLALQPRQRLHHQPLCIVQRPVRGDDQNSARRLPELSDVDPGRPPGLGAAAIPGRAGDFIAGQRGTADHCGLLRGQPQAQQHPAQPERAELCRATGLGQCTGTVQYRLLADAGDCLSQGPQGRDTGCRGVHRRQVLQGKQHRGSPVPVGCRYCRD
ncbi:hypothetical protein D9M70_483530 [compost metagenome]